MEHRDFDPTDHGASAATASTIIVVAGGTVAVAGSSSQTGPILAATVALTVGILTAYTTNRRQARQIAADRAALQDQLSAETDRQRQALENDRRLKDFEHLRTFIDDTASIVERALVLRRRCESDVNAERVRADSKLDFIELAEQLSIQERLMQLRLPSDNPISAAFSDTVTALLGAIRPFGVYTKPSSEVLEEAVPDYKEALKNYGRFLVVARERVGASEQR